MAKGKKGRKGAGDDSNSEAEVEAAERIEKKKSKSKPKSIDVDSDDTEDTTEITSKPTKQQTKSADSDEDDASGNTNTKKTNNKNAKKKRDNSDGSDAEAVTVSKVQKSFAILQVDSNSEDEDGADPQDDEDSDVDSKPKKGKGKKKQSEEKSEPSKGKKSKRKKKDDSDEDLDKVLAELALEYSGVKVEASAQPTELEEAEKDNEDKPKSKKEKKKKKKEESNIEETEAKEEEDGSTVKTAAQKKKEKKEREKQKKQAAKKEEPKDSATSEPPLTEESRDIKEGDTAEVDEPDKDDKKKKKKGGKIEEDKKDPKKGPGKKTIAAMQDALKKLRDDEERMRQEEEERLKQEEEAERARQEALRLEKEKKEKKKQKEKERKERLKAEGKLLTAKQKADRARAQAMLENLRAQGVELPEVGEKKPRPGTRIRPNKSAKPKPTEKVDALNEDAKVEEPEPEEKKVEVEIIEQTTAPESDDDVKDAWDAESSESDSEEVSATSEAKPAKRPTNKQKEAAEGESSEEDDEEDDEDDESDDSSSEDSDDEDDEEEYDRRTDAEKRKERAKARIEERKVEAEKNKTLENLRAAVVCVLGHVDTGKTKILDKLRRTNVQDGEAGGITQQIGATNVPIECMKEQLRIVKGFSEMEFKLPGLLIIDTPGHESFSNLRNRGSSLCDIAILVVDITHGLEPQTIESINLLKNKKTPFVVALNKIDRLYDWETYNRKDVRDIIEAQSAQTKQQFDQRSKEVIVQFAEQGLNAALFYENPDARSYISLVPTSAVTGEGMGNLLSLIVENCQNRLAKRLMYSDELQATVLEVKAIPGLGTTIDCILVNGTLREGDTMVIAGTDGPITTQIRSLLMPQPMKELRVKNAYQDYKEIKAAQGVKIAAKELERAIAGLNLYVAHKPDEVEIVQEEVARELKSALSGIKLQERGVYVQASTLGSLEALLQFLRDSKIPYSGIRIGPVAKRDVMKASIMLEHEAKFATILAFDVKVDRDAQELADSVGVKIFQADIIYHLFDKFMAYQEEIKQKKREEFKHIAVFPCKIRVLPQFVFNSRDPIVMGVMIEAGIVKKGTPICVPSQEFVELGYVTSIEQNHKPIETARKGMEVCIKIEPIPGESPKMFGRHFDEKDFLVSKISRQSIDACKNYFRDDLLKTDWQLMVELKKIFEIL